MDQAQPEASIWRAIYALIVVAALIAFFLSVRAILNPFLLFALVLLLLSPFTGARSHLLVVIAVSLLTLLWLLTTLGSLLAPFFLGLAFAYLLYPLVRRIERQRISRGVAIGLLSLPLITGLALAVLVGIPALGRQFADLINGVPRALEAIAGWGEWLRGEIERRDWPYLNESVLLERLRSVQPDAVLKYLQARQSEIATRVWAGVVGAGKGVSFALSILGYLFLTPILTFYLLRDWERITRTLVDLVPGVSRTRVVSFFQEYDRLLAGYLRGTLLQSAIVGSLTMLGLWLFGIPFAFLLGVMAAVFNIIPYVGLILTLIPALVVALFTGNVLLSLGKVLLVFVLVQAIDGAVIGPKIVGGSVGLHPVWVILALSVAGFFWGFTGLILAVPLAVLLKLLLGLALTRYRSSAFFIGENA